MNLHTYVYAYAHTKTGRYVLVTQLAVSSYNGCMQTSKSVIGHTPAHCLGKGMWMAVSSLL